MQLSNFFLCTAKFALNMQLVQALEWQAYEEIKTVARDSIAAKTQFENSYKGLEYTAMNIQEYVGSYDKVLKFCSEVFGMHESRDIVTVIDIFEHNRAYGKGTSLMPDVVTCLLNYTSNKSMGEYKTDKVRLNVRTMRGRDMYGYEMVNRNMSTKYYLYNYTRRHLIHFIYARIESKIKTYMIEIAYKKVTKMLILNNRYRNRNSKSKFFDHHNFKVNFIREITQATFIQTASNRIVKIISLESRASINLINALGIGIYNYLYQNYKKYDGIKVKECEYTKPFTDDERAKKIEKIKLQIHAIYDKEIKEKILPGIKDGLEKIIQNVREVEDHPLFKSFDCYATWLTQKLSSKEILPLQYTTKKLIKKFRLCYLDRYLKIEASINSIAIFGHQECSDMHNSNRLNDNYNFECCKIVLNEPLTKDNLHLLCRILHNTIDSENVRNRSTVFINMRQSIDFLWYLDDEKGLLLNVKGEDLCYVPTEFAICVGKITMKNKGKYIYKSSVYGKIVTYEQENDSNDSTEQRCKISYAINNLETKIDNIKNIEIVSHSRPSYAIGQYLRNALSSIKGYKRIKLLINSNFASLFLDIKVYKDNQSFELTRTYKLYSAEPIMVYTSKLETINDDRVFNDVFTVDFLPNLINYLKIAALSSFKTDQEIKTQFRNQVYLCKKVNFTIVANSNSELEKLVPIKLDKIQRAIVEFYNEKGNAKVVRLKILLSDFLTRNLDEVKWAILIGSFSRDACIDGQTLVKVLWEFINEQDKPYVTNEEGTLGISTQNYEITICAIIRSEHKTIFYLTKRDHYFEFKHIPMSMMMDTYAKCLTVKYGSAVACPLNCLGITSHALAHPVSYIFKYLSNFETNLLEMIEADSCYEHNMEPYKEMSKLVAQYIHADIPIHYYIGKVYEINKNLKTLYIGCLECILEKEIYTIVQIIKQQHEKMKPHTKLIFAIISFDNLDSSGYEEIGDLKKKIKQEL